MIGMCFYSTPYESSVPELCAVIDAVVIHNAMTGKAIVQEIMKIFCNEHHPPQITSSVVSLPTSPILGRAHIPAGAV